MFTETLDMQNLHIIRTLIKKNDNFRHRKSTKMLIVIDLVICANNLYSSDSNQKNKI
jgi:hypothetical protein